jgi:RNA 3'-terminal phosphate cyclase-like protein
MQPLTIDLKGLTEGPLDIGTDVLRSVTLPLLRESGVAASMTVKQRAVGPHGQGSVHLHIGNLKSIERPIKVMDEGLVRRVRGVAWTVNMGAQYTTALFSSAKGVLLKLLADVQIFTDVVFVKQQPVRSLSLLCLTERVWAGGLLNSNIVH